MSEFYESELKNEKTKDYLLKKFPPIAQGKGGDKKLSYPLSFKHYFFKIFKTYYKTEKGKMDSLKRPV